MKTVTVSRLSDLFLFLSGFVTVSLATTLLWIWLAASQSAQYGVVLYVNRGGEFLTEVVEFSSAVVVGFGVIVLSAARLLASFGEPEG